MPESVYNGQATWLGPSCSLTENVFLQDPQNAALPCHASPQTSPSDPFIYKWTLHQPPAFLTVVVFLNLATVFNLNYRNLVWSVHERPK